MPGRFTLTLIDESREISTASFQGVTLDATNLVAQQGLQDALETAVKAITLGNVVKRVRTADITPFSLNAPSNKAAQRECKLLVVVEDTATYRRSTIELPTFDLNETKAGSDEVDFESAGKGKDLADAIEAYCKSTAGNPVEVVKMVHVGRRV